MNIFLLALVLIHFPYQCQSESEPGNKKSHNIALNMISTTTSSLGSSIHLSDTNTPTSIGSSALPVTPSPTSTPSSPSSSSPSSLPSSYPSLTPSSSLSTSPSTTPTLAPTVAKTKRHSLLPKDVVQAFLITFLIIAFIGIGFVSFANRGRIKTFVSKWLDKIMKWLKNDDDYYEAEPPLNEVVFDYSDRTQIQESLLANE